MFRISFAGRRQRHLPREEQLPAVGVPLRPLLARPDRDLAADQEQLGVQAGHLRRHGDLGDDAVGEGNDLDGGPGRTRGQRGNDARRRLAGQEGRKFQFPEIWEITKAPSFYQFGGNGPKVEGGIALQHFPTLHEKALRLPAPACRSITAVSAFQKNEHEASEQCITLA